MNRSLLFRSAVVIHAIASLFGILSSLPALMQGPSDAGMMQGAPQLVLVAAALIGVAGLVSALGAWRGQKWGIWLTIVLRALFGLLALPGVLFAPNPGGQALATAEVLIGIFVIVVLLRRAPSLQSA
jgi:uncharacterized membrane protein (DUF2068 family)